jgi:hypothetical protein
MTNLAAGNIASGSLSDARLSSNVPLLNGTNVFTGTNRYTETVIITNAASTLSGNGAGMTNLAAGNIASGSLADARLSSNVPLLNGTNVFTGTNRYTGTVIITNAASTFSGNGAGMTNLAAGNIASGSLSDARLSSNVPLLNGTNVFTGTNRYTGTVVITNAASTLSGNGAGMTNLAAGNIASGSLSDARLSANVPLLNGTNVFTGTNSYTGTVVITNAASTLSGNGAGMTNLAAGNIASGSLSDARLSANVPLLNANQTYTGTNTFTAANFFPANMVGRRMLFVTNNIFLSSLATGGGSRTNNGDYALCTAVFSVSLPPLLSSRSMVSVGYNAANTNVNSHSGFFDYYFGSSTNWVGGATPFSTAARHNSSIGAAIFANDGSFTNQWLAIGANNDVNLTRLSGTSTATNWNFYLGANTAGTYTNALVRTFWIEEIVLP